MSFQIGIVGLPNVGKSTLFKALTKKQVDAANYPFCTIDPNVGVVAVPDERLEKLAAVSRSREIIPTTIEFVDIAGLVKNAHKGEGLGNQFLARIREVNAIVEVVREFEDTNVIHVEGGVNPERDRDIIHLELVMADLETVSKRLTSLHREAKSGDKEAIKKVALFERVKNHLEAGNLAQSLEMTEDEVKILKELNLLTLKPIIFVLNIDEKYEDGLKMHPTVAEYRASLPLARGRSVEDESSPFVHRGRLEGVNLVNSITINAKLEAELAELAPAEVQEYLKELNIKDTGLDKLIKASYEILDLITFLTSGEKETRAWTVKRGAKAPEAAGVIHTDFIKGFIRAEVCAWQDFVACGGEARAKEKGLVHVEGKEYEVKDGDTIYFRVST